ncbi:pyridoxal phosphate-dependent transferase [Biscogniauxia mediterranea]|nr:pyridoxal phosphate-dependent transferase [Biscogniauxia mediterranea]
MVKIPAFEVEQWMDKYETTPGVLNISETCASSITLEQLVQLNSQKDAAPLFDLSARMTYGAILGSDGLRRNIADTYRDENEPGATSPVSPEDVIVTQGAISANYLVFYSLIGPGDHVICVFPTYQQLYAVPESLGAEVSLWKLRAEDNYVPDVAQLSALIKSNTKMIVINNPNNPTGATIPGAVLSQIVNIAKAYDLILFSDEVYRPLFHSLPPSCLAPPSVLSLPYPRTLATSSMSKAWALAGIRVGWAATRDRALAARLALARDYTTISVSQLDDRVARYALCASSSVRPRLLARNLALARANLALLERFVESYADICDWVRPTAGTTALVRFRSRRGGGEPVDDVEFCKDLLDKTRVMLVPASKCFGNGTDFRGYVRVGYVSETEVLREALEGLGAYVAENLA